MWPWLLEKLPKRLSVLGTLWFISGSVHVLIFIMACMIGGASHAPNSALVVSSARRQTDARMVLLPMLKTVKGTEFDKPVRGTKFAAAATKKPSPPKKHVKPVPKKPAKVPEKKTQKTTLAALPKEKEKEVSKKTKPVPKPPVKAAEKKSEEKKEVPEQIIAKNEPAEEIKEVLAEQPQEVAGDPNATQDVIYVGRDDLREMQTQSVVADALQKHWQAPSGISNDTCCFIAFDIDAEGRACNLVMKQNSKVLIFDVAARTAILQAHFNPAAQGKQFTVAFKP